MLTTPPTFGTSRGPISISQHHSRIRASQHDCRTPTSQHHGRTPTSQHDCRTPTSQHHGRTPTSQHDCRTPTSQHHGRTPTSSVCLNDRQPNCLPTWSTVNSQMTHFQKLQILRTIASGYDVIHTPASFPLWDLLWQLWLSYHLRTSVNCTQCLCTWIKGWIVQSPIKLNDKI